MTSYTPAAGRPARPARPAPHPGRLVAAPAVVGARAAAVRIVAPLATAAATAGVVAIGGRTALEADGLLGLFPHEAALVPAAGGAAPAIALGLTGAGALLALALGDRASDRTGRRRASVAGLVLLVLAVGCSAVAVLPPAGLLAGIGVVLVAMAAPQWLREARTAEPVAATVALTAAAAGLAAGALLPWWVAAAALLLVLAAAVGAPETVPGPQTPTWGLPDRPDFADRGASAGILALVALAAPFALLPLAPAAIVAGAVALVLLLVVARAAAAERQAARVLAASPAPRPGVDADSRILPAQPAAPVRGFARPAAAGTRAYRSAVSAFDTTERLRPARAVVATSVAEVAAAVRDARDAGTGVRMHSTGHAAGSSSDMRGELLIRTAIREAVTVDPARRLVRVPAGAHWREAVAAAAVHGLAVPHGSSGHVGVVGYLSRGGLSAAYGRAAGIAANRLESVELVTADGRLVTASREHESELFWAIRGGGGGFGVVTAVTVRAFEPGTVVTGTAMWELDDAREVAAAWADWGYDAPRAITTSMRVMRLLPVPGMPFALTRRPLLVIDGTAIDHDGVRAVDAAGELLSGLRRVARPVLDTWRRTDTGEVARTHMDPDIGAAHRSDHLLLGATAERSRARSRAVVDAFAEVAARPDSPLLIAELRQLGGALAKAPEDAGAVGRFDADFAWFTAVMLSRTRTSEAAAAAFETARARFGDWDTGFTAPTFAADRDRPQRSYPEEVRARVERIRGAVDPDGVFRGDVALGALRH